MIHDMHQKKKTLTKQNKRIICKLDDLAATTARLFFFSYGQKFTAPAQLRIIVPFTT